MDDLLFLAHRIPYPPNKGDKVRSYHILRHFANHYRVHLGSFIDDPDDWRYTPELSKLCASDCFLSLKGGIAKLRSLRGFLSHQALTVLYYRDPRLKRWVDSTLAGQDIRRVFVYSSSMAQYVTNTRHTGIQRVIDFVDVDSDKWRQYGATQPWPLSWVYRREHERLLRYERDVAGAFDACVFVCQADASLFQHLAPESANRVAHIPNGVDADHFSPHRDYINPYAPGQKVLVFTGAMDYWPNVDAVSWFARDVLPAIRAHISHTDLYIVGARPTHAVRSLARLEGVHVTGTVPDVRPYLAHAHAAVAPMRIARGIQNKVLEAMAMGKPVVVTPQAIGGINPYPPVDGLVANTVEAFREKVLACLTDSGHRSIGVRLRDFVRTYYDWASGLPRFISLLEEPPKVCD